MTLLTWKAIKTVPTGCPDYVPNQYTGEYPSMHCAVYHCETITEVMSKEFMTEKDAKEFQKQAPDNCFDFHYD